MSASTFTVVRCDRCKAEITLDSDTRPEGWALIQIRDGGSAVFGRGAAADDLCASCAGALKSWWAEPTGPLEQPAPLPPPPKPCFTLEDRRALLAKADELLRGQVAASVAVLREEPTSILSSAILPGAFAGTDERAEAIVAEFVAVLKSRGAA